jgi:hypothetical protein
VGQLARKGHWVTLVVQDHLEQVAVPALLDQWVIQEVTQDQQALLEDIQAV